ncbi:putative magnesium transporter NIPA4 [Vitis vinifera]|uniref:Probable magnesium transporter n=1 Tax=Vitis vinifera TaxID=29760 RepID=A0A438JVU0_VITVI|nr:putative magnesium transporter NIPA4 [Vitis vinifera]
MSDCWEIANFAAYAFAPAILVTPLGALSIIIRHEGNAVLAYIILREKLHIFGILGCVLCVVGSTTIVLHAPQERGIESVKEVWDLATEPAVFILIVHFIPLYGQTHIMVYIGVCSLVGSLSVMSVKALGIALKLTFSGMNQLIYPQTWAFTIVVITCVITQMNYLNKALDTFNTAVVSPIYYAMFTSLTILASVIMFKESWSQTLVVVLKKESENKSYTEFEDVSKKRLRPRLEMNVGSLRVGSSPCLNREKTFACSLPIECWLDHMIQPVNLGNWAVSKEFFSRLQGVAVDSEGEDKDWDRQNPTQIVTEMCGFVTILSGTFLLHKTKDMVEGSSPSFAVRLPKHTDEDGFELEEDIPFQCQDSL